MNTLKQTLFSLAGMIALLFFAAISTQAQKSLILRTQRPPELDVNQYKQIVVGDIVGPLGVKTEQSLDLTDEISSLLFKNEAIEVIDRNALDKILGDQRSKDLQVIDEKTKQALNKKLSNALLITGRIQSEKLEQRLISQDQSIVVNGCYTKYHYQVKGDVRVQVKILDLKTGRMIFNEAVIRPVDVESKADCTVPAKLNVDDISRRAMKELGAEIVKLVSPYEVSTALQFSEPGLFKNPFKQLPEAIAYLETKNFDAGLAILKKYTQEKDSKAKVLSSAYYNYSLGLIYAGKYDEAKQALEKSVSLNAANAGVYKELVALMEKEEQAARKMARMTIDKTETKETRPATKTTKN